MAEKLRKRFRMVKIKYFQPLSFLNAKRQNCTCDDLWSGLEDALRNNSQAKFWWRDDDVGLTNSSCLIGLKRTWRLNKILALLSKYSIPGVYAVIPKKFISKGKVSIRILKRYGAYVAVHGITHTNYSEGNGSEFPDGCDIEANAKTIIDYYNEFSKIFGNRLLPVFVPPWNNICKELEDRLLDYEFSTSKLNKAESHNALNVDIDFINWTTHKLREEKEILKEIISLLGRRAKSIGFNNHFRYNDKETFKFFDKLFNTMQRCNCEWFIPVRTITNQV